MKACHQFMGAAHVDEALYRVKITVREQTKGLRFHDQHSAEIADPDVVSAVQDSPRTTSALRPAAGANINVGNLFRDFNYADGSPVIAEGSERLSFNPRFAGGLKRELLGMWTAERNTLAKRVMLDIEAQRKEAVQ